MNSSAVLLKASNQNCTQPKENIMTGIEQLSYILSGADKELQHRALLYCTYKTIQHNAQISVRHLRSLLSQELFLPDERIDSAVASLTSSSLFNIINRWKPNGKPLESTVLSVAKTIPLEFAVWLTNIEKEHPAVLLFVPPKFVHKN